MNQTINPKALMEKIHFEPHEFQLKIINAYLEGKKKIVVSAGQRSGKSMACAFLVVLELMADRREVLVISPSYSLTDRVFEYVKRWLSEFFNQPVNYIAKPFPRIEMPWGSYVEGKSAESPEQILGKSYNLIVVDEASRIPREIFEQYLFPRIGEKKGRMAMISTPLKRDWFYEEFMMAKEQGSGFQFGTLANPHYPKESYETFRKQLPKAIFDREFEGVFTDQITSIFPNVLECVSSALPREGHLPRFHYVGLDLAKEEDWTAITIADSITQEIVYTARWQKIPYSAQLQKVVGIISRYQPCRVVIDSRNIGAIFGEQLRHEGIATEDWVSVGTISPDFAKRGSKEKLVEKMMALFESHSISIPRDPDLIDELSSYSYVISEMGNVRYGVPSGLHDDLVDSLMLCCWNLDIKAQTTESELDRQFRLGAYQQKVRRIQRQTYI